VGSAAAAWRGGRVADALVSRLPARGQGRRRANGCTSGDFPIGVPRNLAGIVKHGITMRRAAHARPAQTPCLRPIAWRACRIMRGSTPTATSTPPSSTPTATPWWRARAPPASAWLVLPAVEAANFDTVRALAHRHGLAYALGIHPLYVDRAADDRPGPAAAGAGRVTATTRGWWRWARSAWTTSCPAWTASASSTSTWRS
jgi:hypothetical protein